METNVRTPMQIFSLPQQLEVPLFQRPYVWDQEDQWQPFWEDIRRLAETRLGDPGSTATHFLGAVVVQAHESPLGTLSKSNIIDGQQRLTTLQLLMDAAGAVLESAGFDGLAGQLESLTHNPANFLAAESSPLKIRHTNRDRAAFDEVMGAEPPIDHASLQHHTSRIVRAHGYFVSVVASWLGTGEDQASRAQALVGSLTSGLQLVAINLTAAENSQEIFETLNARGTPLTAADLIKNFVFQQLAAEGADTKRAYVEQWPFDTKFWEANVSVGRYNVSRGSLFLNHWLVSQLGEEVGPAQTFSRFKTYVTHNGATAMRELLPSIKEQADRYEAWSHAAEDPDRQLSVVEMAMYRMSANDVHLLKPILIWLHSRDLPKAEREAVILACESWITRRMLLRLTSADLGRVVADIIALYRDATANELTERVTSHLSRLNVSSTYWPGDVEIREALRGELAYRRFRRGRLRMFLEAIENAFRSRSNQPQVPRRGYPIEHVMPQKWVTHWPVDGAEAEQTRTDHIHRLGNLTLLTTSLNSTVSNSGWATKREALRQHDTLLLNSRMLAHLGDDGWSEENVDARTEQLTDALLAIWPVPTGHTGTVVDPQQRSSSGPEIQELVAAGVLTAGTELTPRPGNWESRKAIVRADGRLLLDGKLFDSPSGAGKHLRGGATNGWHFWRLPDGRKLVELRAATPAGALTPRMRAYQDFWGDLLATMTEDHPRWTQSTTPPAQSWITLPYGSSTIWYGMAFTNTGARVELFFGGTDPEVNNQAFERFTARRELLEAEFGELVRFDPLPENKSCRISVDRLGCDVEDGATREDTLAWFIETFARFRPITQQIRTEIRS